MAWTSKLVEVDFSDEQVQVIKSLMLSAHLDGAKRATDIYILTLISELGELFPDQFDTLSVIVKAVRKVCVDLYEKGEQQDVFHQAVDNVWNRANMLGQMIHNGKVGHA